MGTQLFKLLKKNLNRPDELNEFPRGRVEIVNLEERSVARIRLEPGWKWSEDVRPTAGTELCEVGHVQYVIRGRLALKTGDGQVTELEAGDLFEVGPGHEAWVIGNETFEAIDLTGMKGYAKKPEEEG